MIDRDRNSHVDVLITVPFSEGEIQTLAEVSPRLRIHFLPVREVREIPGEILNRCEVMYTDRVLPAPDQVPALRWMQLHFAGADFALEQPIFHKPELLVTTLSGAAAPQMAEYALTMLLALGHRLPEITASQARAEWPRERWERFRPQELRDSTVGIVGYGSIGREIARLLHAFGANVLAVKRDVMHPEDPGYLVPGLGDPGGDLFQRLYPYQALKSMLKECDFVVVVLPLTTATRGMIGADELGAMKSTAYLISMARGGIIDQAALLTALQEKHIAGAALDVFAEEPLAANHPFWRLPNVYVSAHIGGMSTQYNSRAMDLFIENCKRYLAGSPVLNRFDVVKGY
jgi:phosphoglycerate dehydrogenase-like enzyme